MKILIILIVLTILAFLVVFCFCACVLAHDADQHLEMMEIEKDNIFNIEKEEK